MINIRPSIAAIRAAHEAEVQLEALATARRKPSRAATVIPLVLTAASAIGLVFLTGFLYGAAGLPRAVAVIQDVVS